MGTGTSRWRDSRGSTCRVAEPVPIFFTSSERGSLAILSLLPRKSVHRAGAAQRSYIGFALALGRLLIVICLAFMYSCKTSRVTDPPANFRT